MLFRDTGKRLADRDLSSVALLNYVLAHLLSKADAEGRRKIQLALTGLLSEDGREIISDPDLPEHMQGMVAPAWWNSDHDPLADQYQLPR